MPRKSLFAYAKSLGKKTLRKSLFPVGKSLGKKALRKSLFPVGKSLGKKALRKSLFALAGKKPWEKSASQKPMALQGKGCFLFWVGQLAQLSIFFTNMHGTGQASA